MEDKIALTCSDFPNDLTKLMRQYRALSLVCLCSRVLVNCININKTQDSIMNEP